VYLYSAFTSTARGVLLWNRTYNTCLDDTYTAVDKYNNAKKTTNNNKPIRITYFVKRDNSEQLQNTCTDNKTPGPNTKQSQWPYYYSCKLWASLFCLKWANVSTRSNVRGTSVRRREIDVAFWPFSDDGDEYMRFITGRPWRPRDV